MKKMLFIVISLLMTVHLVAQQDAVKPYFSTEELPNLIKCLPAPPEFNSPEFTYDVVRYQWGKTQRLNPARADTIFARGWIYGESRVIEGAHWQSDVDASRVAASIGYAALQTSAAFRNQMEKAKKEFNTLTN